MNYFTREPYRSGGRTSSESIVRRLTSDDELPVGIADLRLDLRVDDNDDDATLTRMEKTAIALIAERSGAIIMPGRFEALFDACANPICVRRFPLRQLTAVQAMTGRDEWTDLDLGDFRVIQREKDFEVRTFPGFVAPTFYCPDLSVRLEFTAGFSGAPDEGKSEGDDANILPDLYRGVLIGLVAHFYENRELFMADKLTEIESTAGGLLNSIRTFW